MFGISEKTLERLKKEYPVGARVELTHMNDPWNTKLQPGCRGTVRHVDDIGTVFVAWDCGSSLGVAYGEDSCRQLEPVKTVCYGEERLWEDRKDAMKFFARGAAECDGCERERYMTVYMKLSEGASTASDDPDEG